ncbi:MAG: flavodoxin family protein [Erysipelotrichaceae bacterium]|jgi:multimeric flavodoxin WrbA
MIILISDDSKINYSDMIRKALTDSNEEIVVFNAESFNIEPCRACSSCSGKTYGHCILEDDLTEILSEVIRSEKIILVSPIVYGGVSFHIKKIMDRLASIGDPRYYINNGEMVKKMRIPDFEYYMVGIKENLTEEEKSAFIQLHSENIKIMSVKGKVFTVDNIIDKKTTDRIVKEICYV